MYLPEITKLFRKGSGVFKDYKQLGILTRQAGPLDEKTQDWSSSASLSAQIPKAVSCLTPASASGRFFARGNHSRRAAGAYNTGFPNMIAALRWVDTVLNRSEPEA